MKTQNTNDPDGMSATKTRWVGFSAMLFLACIFPVMRSNAGRLAIGALYFTAMYLTLSKTRVNLAVKLVVVLALVAMLVALGWSGMH